MSLKEAFESFIANNLHSETIYAKLLTELDGLTLTYSSGDESYTNGKNIVIAPCMMNLATDQEIIQRTLHYLNWDKFKPNTLAMNTEDVLFIMAHALLIHECFHICYSTFPPLSNKDASLKPAEQKLAGAISNIIEDAYIEAIGSSYYNNVHHYLRFARTAVALYGNKHRTKNKSKRLVEELLLAKDTETILSKTKQAHLVNAQKLTSYLNYVTEAVLFPLSNAKLEPELQELVDRTLPLFFKGSMQGTAAKRYSYAKRILSIIKEYISLDTLPMNKLLNEVLEAAGTPMPGRKSHKNQSSKGEQSDSEKEYPQEDCLSTDEVQGLAPTRSLFGKAEEYSEGDTPADTAPSEAPLQYTENAVNTEHEGTELQDFLQKLDKELEESKEETITELSTPAFTRQLNGANYGNPNHTQIKIPEEHYAPLKAYRHSYEEIVKKHQDIIKRYRTRFQELIQAKVKAFEGGYRLGLGIDSNRLADVKKRYWTRRCEDRNTPELAVEIIIDGSGSMYGSKIHHAQIAAIIMHEVLAASCIPHCITQHYANFSGPVHNQQVLLDYNARPNDKYNLMRISSNEDNRDGLALLWAEKHIRSRREENKVIIIISDGQPHHSFDRYSGRVADEDTKNCARLINKRGVKVIAVAIETNGHYIYDSLKPIYDNIVSCNDMKQLPQKLAEIITSLLKE